MNSLSIWLRCACSAVGAAAALASAHAGVPPEGDTLRVAAEAGDHGFDPANDIGVRSMQMQESVFDRLYAYDPSSMRPLLVPLAAAARPQMSIDGRRLTVTLRRGRFFHADPALGGRPRELVAHDVAYSIRRLAEPGQRSPVRDLLTQRIEGLASWSHARAAGRAGFDAPVAGIEVIARYTLRFRLTEPDFDFAYLLATPASSILAREAIEFYGERARHQPVGSGAFALCEGSVAAARLTLCRKPAAAASPRGNADRSVAAVQVSFFADEAQRFAHFDRGQADVLDRPGTATLRQVLADAAPSPVPAPVLAPALVARRIRLEATPEPEIIYYYLNFDDAVVGGEQAARRALREAIVRSFDVQEEIRSLRLGVGRVARTPLPPGVNGHALPGWMRLQHDPEAANRLLDAAGFRRGADGWRTNPDGSPLVITFSSEPLDVVKPYADLRQRGLAAIGLRSVLRMQSFAENLRSSQRCGLAFWGSTWRAVIPTELYFLQLLYGAHVERGINLACYRSERFDRWFEQAKRLPPGARRDARVRRMLQQAEADAVWQLGTNRMALALLQPTVRGYRQHPMLHSVWASVTLAAPLISKTAHQESQ